MQNATIDKKLKDHAQISHKPRKWITLSYERNLSKNTWT